jgi:hypothetical protein
MGGLDPQKRQGRAWPCLRKVYRTSRRLTFSKLHRRRRRSALGQGHGSVSILKIDLRGVTRQQGATFQAIVMVIVAIAIVYTKLRSYRKFIFCRGGPMCPPLGRGNTRVPPYRPEAFLIL